MSATLHRTDGVPSEVTDEQIIEWAIEEQFLLFCDEEDVVQIVRSAFQKWAGVAAPSGWQPIETAPKDGTEVLLWLRAPWSRVEQLCWREEIGGWLVKGIEPKDAEGMCGSLVPTHWMPLPPAPNQGDAS